MQGYGYGSALGKEKKNNKNKCKEIVIICNFIKSFKAICKVVFTKLKKLDPGSTLNIYP